MEVLIMSIILAVVVWMYFARNPMKHSKQFQIRRFWNWFPLGLSYAFLYMGRYNLNIVKNALGSAMSNQAFGLIFGIGTLVYGSSMLLTAPTVDRIGGKKGILIATSGAAVCNIAMGIAVYMFLHGQLHANLALTLTILYAANMFFQSYGCGSINKNKAYWFHVRERGIFGGIFGTLLSFGIYFAFDWNSAIAGAIKADIKEPTMFQSLFIRVFGGGSNGIDAIWWIFWIPAGILIFWSILDIFLIADSPSDANFEDFDTADASTGEMDKNFSVLQLLAKVFTHPVLLMVCAVEFTTGVVRNGVVQWYNIYAAQVPQIGAEYFAAHWGFLLAVTGIFSGFTAGYISDAHFQSRRGPPVVLAGIIMVIAGIVMAFSIGHSPITVALCGVLLALLSISIHALMSGTAAADFGGRKAAATASGITDAFVYLGTALQSIGIGYLSPISWTYWPLFLIPFSMIGLFIATRMWHSLPAATRRYLAEVEHIDLGGATE